MTEPLQGRPNFNGNSTVVPTPTAITGGNVDGNKMKQAGAIWQKTSNDGNTKYLSISLTTDELEGIITKAKGDNKTKIDLVAFLNDKDGNEARPDFRIFESRKRV